MADISGGCHSRQIHQIRIRPQLIKAKHFCCHLPLPVIIFYHDGKPFAVFAFVGIGKRRPRRITVCRVHASILGLGIHDGCGIAPHAGFHQGSRDHRTMSGGNPSKQRHQDPADKSGCGDDVSRRKGCVDRICPRCSHICQCAGTSPERRQVITRTVTLFPFQSKAGKMRIHQLREPFF